MSVFEKNELNSNFKVNINRKYMDHSIQNKLDQLEKKYLKLRLMFIFILFLIISVLVFLSFKQSSVRTDNILEVKGLVVKDDQGRPRIIIGAPIKNIKGRNRPDEFYGMAYIDPSGADRITIGSYLDPMTGKGVAPRRVQGAGMLIHDREGVERGGYGVLDDDMAILTLDWPKKGEAIALSSGNIFSAIGIFHKRPVGQYMEAITIGTLAKESRSFLKVSDTLDNQRLLLSQEGSKEIDVKYYDKNGKEINKSKSLSPK